MVYHYFSNYDTKDSDNNTSATGVSTLAELRGPGNAVDALDILTYSIFPTAPGNRYC